MYVIERERERQTARETVCQMYREVVHNRMRLLSIKQEHRRVMVDNKLRRDGRPFFPI